MTAGDPLAVLRLIRTGSAGTPRPTEPAQPAGPMPRAGAGCELCREPIGEPHGHLVDLEARSLLCSCHACYLLFTPDGARQGRYRAVPQRYLAFPDLRLSAAQWDALQIPVGVAFFFVNSALGRVAAFYPGPAGATESLLPVDAWQDVTGGHPTLGSIEPDVEAVLVRTEHGGESGAECFLVPIDACYELVGHLRRLWRGFDGGSEANDALDAFFDRVRGRAVPA